MKAFVYFNSVFKRFSVKALEGGHKGTVVLSTDTLVLRNCEFRVSVRGRERVLREKRRNVHAGIIGEVVVADSIPGDGILVSYNPYRAGHFTAMDGSPVLAADLVVCRVEDRIARVRAYGVA